MKPASGSPFNHSTEAAVLTSTYKSRDAAGARTMEEEPDTQARILRALRFRPKGMTITEVAKRIGATRNSVSKHLEILQIAGRVDVRNVGNAKLYSLAQRVPMSAFLCFTKNLILILDGGGRIVQINDRCQQALGRSKDDLLGLTLAEAELPVVSTPEALAVVAGLEHEQVIADLRYRSDGKDFFYQMQAIPTTFDDGEKGCTLVLEDITERKRYVRNMEFLARTAMELVDLPAEVDLYRYVGERVLELVPGALVFLDSYDDANRQFSMQVILDQEFREGLKKIVGRDVVGMVFRLDDLADVPHRDTVNSVFMMREHVFGPSAGAGDWSFYDICFRQIPREICDEILSTFNIGKLIGISFVWQEHLFGVVGIFLPPDRELEDREVIESFIRQASIAIARRQTEDRLRRSEHRFREVLEFSPGAAALIDADGRYTFLNRRFTDLFGYTLDDIPTGTEWFMKAFPDEHKRREAIAAWQSDLEEAAGGEARSRTFTVRCRDGAEKAILFRPVQLCDGTQYVTCEDVTEDRRAYGVLVEEIAALRQQLASRKVS